MTVSNLVRDGMSTAFAEYEYRKSHVESEYENRLPVLEYEYSGSCTRVPSSRTRVRVQDSSTPSPVKSANVANLLSGVSTIFDGVLLKQFDTNKLT